MCEELLASGHETGSLTGSIDENTLAALMAEISDPELQRTVLRLSLAAARADGHLADGETRVVEAARRHWPMPKRWAPHFRFTATPTDRC